MSAPNTQRRPAGCPSNLELDELAAGDLAGDRAREQRLREHLASCAVCRDRAAVRAADPVLVPDASTIRALQAAQATGGVTTRPRGSSRARVAAGAGVAAAAAVAALVIFAPRTAQRQDAGAERITERPTERLPERPTERLPERAKGGLALTLHVKRASSNGAIEAINGEGELRAGDEMRFTITAEATGYAVVLGLDATPAVTVYAPHPAGAPPPRIEPGRPITLDGSMIADDARGFERIVAILCDTAASPELLRRQAQAALVAAGGRPQAVSSLGSGCLERSVLLRKSAP